MNKLISASEVISKAFIDQNINTAKIKDAYIEVAQESYLRPILGDDFYDEVLANYTTSPYSTLVAQLKSALAFYVKYIALPEIMVSVTDKGALLAQSSSNQPLDAKGRGDVRATALQMADNYAKIAIRWLESDSIIGSYPGYSEGKNIQKRITRKGGLII